MSRTDTAGAAWRPVLLLIVTATLVRLGFAWALGLGVDESYMVAAGRVLRWGYFDHPPAAWWLQWGAAHLFGTEAPIAVRTPFILCFALSTWLMYRLGAAVANERAGLWAAVALTLSPVFGVTTGTWVLPDGPLDLALLGAALCLVHALPARGGVAWGWWIGAGLCAGLALFSKYTAVLTVGGAFVYLLTSREHRRWLAHPAPWVAGVLAVAVFSPVLIWNAAHGWASFAFQGGRAEGFRLELGQPFVVLAGEALFVLPWIWAAMMAASLAALGRGPAAWRSWLLLCLGAPPIVAFSVVAAWSGQRVLFHWAAPGYLMLFPLLGAALAEWIHWAWVRGAVIGTAVLVVGAVGFVSAQVRLDLLRPLIASVSRGDPDLQAIDWTSLRVELRARGLLTQGAVVGAANWRDAGKIGYAMGPGVPVVCLNEDAREFGFQTPASAFVGRNVVVLAVDHAERVRREMAERFDALVAEAPATIMLNGRVVTQVSVFTGLRLR